MNKQSLQALDNDGLKLVSRELERLTGHVTEYEALKRISHGQFLLKELKVRRDYALSCYKHIDPAHEHALLALVKIQGAEIEAEHWINRIENSGEHLNQLQTERETLVEVVEHRKKQADEGSGFIPSALKKDTK